MHTDAVNSLAFSGVRSNDLLLYPANKSEKIQLPLNLAYGGTASMQEPKRCITVLQRSLQIETQWKKSRTL